MDDLCSIRSQTISGRSIGALSSLRSWRFADYNARIDYVPSMKSKAMHGRRRLAWRFRSLMLTATCHVGGSLGIQAADIGPAVADGIVDIASNAFMKARSAVCQARLV